MAEVSSRSGHANFSNSQRIRKVLQCQVYTITYCPHLSIVLGCFLQATAYKYFSFLSCDIFMQHRAEGIDHSVNTQTFFLGSLQIFNRCDRRWSVNKDWKVI